MQQPVAYEWWVCREEMRNVHFKKASFQGLPFRILSQLGGKRRLKHSSQSDALRFGRVAPKRMNDALAKDRISSQFWRGTAVRILRCLRDASYSWVSRLRMMGPLHGFRASSSATMQKVCETCDIFMRDSRSSCPSISAMRSRGSCWKDMAVAKLDHTESPFWLRRRAGDAVKTHWKNGRLTGTVNALVFSALAPKKKCRTHCALFEKYACDGMAFLWTMSTVYILGD